MNSEGQVEERNCFISPVRKKRLHSQGYENYTDTELFDFRLGFRFAYFMCGFFVLIGLSLSNSSILSFMVIIAFLGAIFHTHPFDLLYNYLFRFLFNKPKIPPRSNQGRFACAIATVWLIGTIFLFYAGTPVLGYLAGIILIFLTFLVSVLDICIPSMVYNFLFRRSGS